MPKTYKTTEQLFWAKVKKSDKPDGCHIWIASTSSHGYGEFKVNGKTWKAHRWIWTKNHGTIPVGMNICHHCDNPSCVRDDHLYLGTQQDNVNDRQKRNRQTSHKGQLNGRAKLTEKQIPIIRLRLNNKESQIKIANDYNVCQGTISDIKLNVLWKHI